MTVYEKLMQVQQELVAPKNQYNSFGKYNYRSCEDILEGLKVPMSRVKASVVISDDIVLVGDRYYVKATATFIDAETGESVSNSAFARESDDKKGMDSSQVTGATSSYARKYALNGLFCIDDVKDADTRDNSDSGKKTETKTDAIAKTYIDTNKVTALQKKCESDGVSIITVMDKLHVKDLTKITEKQFSWMLANWTKEFKSV